MDDEALGGPVDADRSGWVVSWPGGRMRADGVVCATTADAAPARSGNGISTIACDSGMPAPTPAM